MLFKFTDAHTISTNFFTWTSIIIFSFPDPQTNKSKNLGADMAEYILHKISMYTKPSSSSCKQVEDTVQCQLQKN
jgi:hypothetical protein